MWTRNIVRNVLPFVPLFFLVCMIAVSYIPEVSAANANLFVSAENSQFDNYFVGPMVIEVVIIDPDIAATNAAQAEPDITVNGKDLRMVQAENGNWYAYFADVNQAQIADSTTSVSGIGLDFGIFCANNDGDEILGFDVSDTVGFAVDGAVPGSTQGQTDIVSEQCTSKSNGVLINNVVRQPQNVNTTGAVLPGQIGLDTNAWPFIQLYDFTPTGNVVVQYNKGGGIQTTTLTFDTVSQFVNVAIDRSMYPQGSEVHLTITDVQLNIDPTDEDSWTWDTSDDGTLRTLYQIFDKNGQTDGDGISANQFGINPSLSDLMFEDNGILKVDIDASGLETNVLSLQDNDDQRYIDGTGEVAKNSQLATDVRTEKGTLGAGTQPITVTEQGVNSGIFGSYDESDKSNIVITDNAPRGSSAIIDYNDNPLSVVVGFDFASIDIQSTDVEWNSGEEIPIVLVDGDANKNSRSDEDLDLNNPKVQLIPSLVTGNPFTLESLVSAQVSTNIVSILSIEDVQLFSQRAILTSPGLINSTGTFSLQLTLENTYNDLYNSINDPGGSFNGFNFFNYDVRSIGNSMTGGSANSVDIILSDPTGGKSVAIASNEPLQGFITLIHPSQILCLKIMAF